MNTIKIETLLREEWHKQIDLFSAGELAAFYCVLPSHIRWAIMERLKERGEEDLAKTLEDAHTLAKTIDGAVKEAVKMAQQFAESASAHDGSGN